jgi:hypothetical protein
MADRVYFDIKNLDDALLRTYVTPFIIAESTQNVESLALSFGVSPQQIVTPTPYKISDYAKIFAYMRAAQSKAMFSSGEKADNDSFSLKYTMYRQQLKDREASITKLTFTNGVQAKKRKFPLTMPMERN